MNRLKLGELAKAGRNPSLPLILDVPSGELLIESWLRVLPGQRYVGRAEWKGRQVLVKVLVGD